MEHQSYKTTNQLTSERLRLNSIQNNRNFYVNLATGEYTAHQCSQKQDEMKNKPSRWIRLYCGPSYLQENTNKNNEKLF